ncbi:type I restriction modification DNA specificity domain protein [Alloscardovia omnicolens F0580]|uniref:Type I restriction modification DNA specificity domain protein n=1 Tax=Alloscardovia omnicolens F0580 TaxID=1321816 RepID=U1QUB2_9BIFI|nr:restriction endonuclease subunit S [Alloscardovia omnicolens]ERH31010.1 type I restriction modification DNA specificity domain protein [Alloscardovia omnicolens F0580]
MMKVKLGDVCERGSSNLKQSDVVDKQGDYPIYGAAGYIGNVDFYHQEKPYVAVVKDGAGIGRTTLCSAKSSVIGTMQYLLPKDNVLPEYLYYVVRHMHLEKYFTGATIPHIYFKDYKNEEFSLDSLNKQNEIVQTLAKIEKSIETRQIEIKLLDELIKARFVEMFGSPVSNPKKWQVEAMNDVAPIVNYAGSLGDDVWLLNLDMVEAQTGEIIEYLIVSKEMVGNSTCTFDTTNVLYSKLRPYLNKVVIPDRCGYATSELLPLKPLPTKLNREYLTFLLRTDDFVKLISAKVTGAKMPRVSMKDFKNFDVPIPPLSLQNEFAAFVSQVDKSKVV